MDRTAINERVEQEKNRVLGKIATRTNRPKKMFWLSFAGEEGFRGACIVHAEEFTEAVMEATLHDCNPHGEVQGMEVPAGHEIPEKWKYRVLSRQKCADFDKEMIAGGE